VDTFRIARLLREARREAGALLELQYLGSLDESNLIAVRDHAKKLGVAIEVGTRTCCPTSKSFDPKQGTGEEQMLRAMHAAHVTGSPIVRTFMGTSNDRDPIERHMEAMTALLKSLRTRIVDLNLKIAIENHAGDMQARELKGPRRSVPEKTTSASVSTPAIPCGP